MENTAKWVVLGGVAAFFGWAATGSATSVRAYAPPPATPRRRKEEARTTRWSIVPAPSCTGWRSRTVASDQMHYRPLKVGSATVSVQPQGPFSAKWESLRSQQTMPANLCPFDDFMVQITGPIGPEDFPGKEWVKNFEAGSISDYADEREFPSREPSARTAEKQRRRAKYHKGANVRIGREAEYVSANTVTRILADLAQKQGLRLSDVGE